MRQEYPEFRGSGGGRGGGVKAVEGSSIPSPGGTTARLGSDEHPCGLRRGVSKTAALGTDAGSDGPAGERGVLTFHPARSSVVPHAGRRVDRTHTGYGGEGDSQARCLRHPASSLSAALETPEIPELSLASSAEITDSEKVTDVIKPICPPVARRNEGFATRNCRGREPVATAACHALTGLGDGCGRLTWAFSPGYLMWGLQPRRRGSASVLSILRSITTAEDGRSRATAEGGPYRIRLRRGEGITPESWCDFIWQNAGGELVTREDCPEFHWGKATLSAKAESGKLKAEIQGRPGTTGGRGKQVCTQGEHSPKPNLAHASAEPYGGGSWADCVS